MDIRSFFAPEIQSDSELSTLIAEILSLESERKDFLESLTPRISCWVDEISGTATSSVRKKVDSKEPFGILEDIEDLGHRMLSMSHFLSSSHAPISLYKADELVSTTSKLMKISEDFYKSTEKAMEEAAEEKRKKEKKARDRMRRRTNRMKKKQQKEEEEEGEGTSQKINKKMERKEEDEEEKKMRKEQEVRKIMLSHEFLRLSSNVLARPCCYKNELAMMITEEDEQEYERVREAEREAERRREKSKQRKQRLQKKQQIVEEEHADEQETKSPTEQLKEWMDNELGFFDGRRSTWEYSSGSKAGQCGRFEDKTTLSPMQFTHCTPGINPPRAAVTEGTLQIYSFKIIELKNLKWPLYVYGVVAARDTVDRNRNLLFSRSSIMCQVLTENDCSLCLTGPSRAILAVDPVDFEVELKIHDGGDELKDRELICVSNRYDEADNNGEQPFLTFHSPLCRAELRLERLPTTVQATILSVRVVGGGSPFKSGGQVACSSSTADAIAITCEKVVLLDSVEEIPEEDGLDGYLPLSRNVVSVELQGGLDVVVKAYGGSGSTSGHVYFPSQYCNTSQGKCSVCGSEVEITVAWSRLVRDKMDMLIEGYTTQA